MSRSAGGAAGGPSARAVTVRAAAKINLHLGVGAVRPDGFHPLCTVYQALSLYDDVRADPAEQPGEALALTVTGSAWVDVAGVPVEGPELEQNLAVRAVRALEEHHGRSLPARLTITKAIPVAGGLAGGSADAAAALVAIDRLHDLQTSDDDLLAIAARLGSDIPFSLLGGTALGTGRGELVEPVPDAGSWWWVVVPSDVGLSTPAVYRRFDDLRVGEREAGEGETGEQPAPATAVLTALAAGDPQALAAALHNDLQDPALDLRPELGDLIDRGESLGALRGLVSGSGPTVLFLAASATDARELAAALREDGVAVALVAHGPVAGAHLVEGIA